MPHRPERERLDGGEREGGSGRERKGKRNVKDFFYIGAIVACYVGVGSLLGVFGSRDGPFKRFRDPNMHFVSLGT